jgi:hypothetical protein
MTYRVVPVALILVLRRATVLVWWWAGASVLPGQVLLHKPQAAG